MQIVIAGTGNTATVLGKKLKAAGHHIVQVFGRNHEAAILLANELEAYSCSSWAGVTQHAELYLIAVADQALLGGEVHLKLKDQIVVHTAGAVPMAVLKNISSSYGVLYPFQTIRKEVEPLPEIPLLVDANTDAVKEKLLVLAKSMAKQVSLANDEERIKYHLCGVMTNNFSNYLYTLTEAFCEKNGIRFSNLLPLIDETASRLHHFSPRQLQTGPAVRKDGATIERHLALLKDEPVLKKVYQLFSEEIMKYHR